MNRGMISAFTVSAEKYEGQSISLAHLYERKRHDNEK